MTDRFYPVGLKADMDAWKTTYEVQNEMRSFARSAYPPGTAVHLPGSRDEFGYSTPGPIRERLAQPELFLSEDVDVPNPRETHAVPRWKVPDDRLTFLSHDTEEMGRSYNSEVAVRHFSPDGSKRIAKSFVKSKSLPTLVPASPAARVCEPPAAVTNLEDDFFTYFVPKDLQCRGQDKLNPHLMSKLNKKSAISFPFSGDGTGFRTQSGRSEIFPEGSYLNMPTSYRNAFKKPSAYRLAPISNF